MPTKIEWAEESWNPVTGCTAVSEGCENCYARRMAKRLAGRYGYPADGPFRVTLHPERLEQPFKWRKPRRIFVCSMGDLFHPDVPFGIVHKIFDYVAVEAGQHVYIVLTKRPERLKQYINEYEDWNPSEAGNIWLGVSAENQARADERIPVLLSIPAAVRFVSIEPMLGRVNLRPVTRDEEYTDYLKGERGATCQHIAVKPEKLSGELNWVIVGAETGPGRRMMLPRWARDVKDQCVAAGVPFFFKQAYRNDGTLWRLPELDGRVWNEYPEAT